MQAVSTSLQLTSYPVQNGIETSPFNHLSDEMLVQIFALLPTTSLASSLFPVCHEFRRIAHDKTLIKEEIQACKKIIQDIIAKNPDRSKISECIKDIEIKWEQDSWITMMALSKKLAEVLDGLSLEELAEIIPPQQHLSAPLVDKFIHKQFQMAWLKKLEPKLSSGVQLVPGCFLAKTESGLRLKVDSNLSEKHLSTLSQSIAQNVLPVTELSFYKEIDHPPIRAVVTAFLNSLSTNRTIRTLRMQHCLVQDEEIQALVASLNTKKDLENLYIDEFAFTRPGMQAFAHVLEHYPNLKDLVLEGWIDAEIRPLLESLGRLHLETLVLSKGTLSQPAANLLAEALKTNTKLKTLNFSGTRFDDQAIETITDALWNNSTIQDLYIPGKFIPALLARKPPIAA